MGIFSFHYCSFRALPFISTTMNPTPPKSDSKETSPPQAAASQVPVEAVPPIKIPISQPSPSQPLVKKGDALETPSEKSPPPSAKEIALKAGVQKNTPEIPSTAKGDELEVESTQKSQRHKGGAEPLVPMRSLLNHFAVEFCNKIDPVCQPLKKLEGLVSELPEKSSLHKVLPELRDVRHHIQALLEKVKEQQAYVLIFGPLKSGKSTLMNAICASYVSEVTSLPAYPCLVNISYSEKPQYRAVQYDGKMITFDDQNGLHNTIERAHEDLTNKLREVEGRGETFDPVEHMPGAFRNIDIKLTTPELAASSAVLVDTPGLYSRMKFGYDQMTRDFRNTAACAIFVVKSDNLFLEQVFEEFTELLELFSRIFLIVNLDSRKMDLNASGELVPSLEKKDPEKIIQAFRNLAMSAPLKEAVDDGRLRIYPVDLLSAASGRIQADKGSQEGGEKDVASVEQFDNLRGDLINFLNSNDYLKSFLVDSVRRGSSLMDSVHEFLKNPSFAQAKVDIEELESEKKVLLAECQALANLGSENWNDRSAGLVKELENEIKDSAQSIKKSTATQIAEILEQWWQDDTSLHDLKEQQLQPCFEKEAQTFVEEVSQAIALKTANTRAGLEVSDSVARDLGTLKIDLRSIGEQSLELANPATLSTRMDLQVADIPVKKRFRDWLFLRSARKVKKDVFGDEQKPTQTIPAGIKEKRLGEAGREAILKQCREHFGKILDDSALTLPPETVAKYVAAVTKNMAGICEAKDAENKRVIAEKEKLIDANASALKESELIKKETTEIEKFIKKTYPLPDWPENQSEKDS